VEDWRGVVDLMSLLSLELCIVGEVVDKPGCGEVEEGRGVAEGICSYC
jgi:hypothetical protein